MKKVSFLATTLGLAAFLTLAGYAQWNEQITVSNAVQSGEMRVEFVQEQVNGNNNQLHNIYPNIDGNDLNNDKSDDLFTTAFQHGPTVTTFAMGNLYPGTTVWYEVKIKNLGTIPATLNNIDVEFAPNSSQSLKDNLMVRGQLQHWKKQWNGSFKPTSEYSLPLAGTKKYGDKAAILGSSSSNSGGTGSGSGNGTANGSNLVTLGELEPYLNALIKANKQTLNPDDYFTLDIDEEYKAALLNEQDLQGMTIDPQGTNCLWFTLPKDADNATQSQNAYFSIRFNFRQFNDQQYK